MAAAVWKIPILSGFVDLAQDWAKSVGSLIRRWRRPIELLGQPQLSGTRQEAKIVLRSRRLRHEMGLSDYSDRQLQRAIQKISQDNGKGSDKYSATDELAAVLAIVDECFRRRLGVWRLFSDTAARSGFENCFTAPDEGDFPDSSSAADRVLAEGINRVLSAGPAGSEVLLSADFYRAALDKDTSNALSFNPTDAQLLAAVCLFRGRVVEMPAGEGKTVAIAFAAVLHALLGRSVHVLTANEYLADRDRRLMAPVYRALGLSVGIILESLEPNERRDAYSGSIVYGTLREFGFDYLRDNLSGSPADRVQPALDVALVDEVDQALVDEAATPLIIAGEPLAGHLPLFRVNRAVVELIAAQQEAGRRLAANLAGKGPEESDYGPLLCQALLATPKNQELRRLARQFPGSWRKGVATVYPDGGDYPDEMWLEDLYYVIDPWERFVTLTAGGVAFLEKRLGAFGGTGVATGQALDSFTASGRIGRRLALANQIYQSLRAHLLLEKGVDYVVADDAVILLDQHTGRIKPDSLYQDGLQPALESKEAVPIHSDFESLAQISVQGFVARYRTLAGISGTVALAAAEFERRYSLVSVVIPAANPVRRTDLPSRIYENDSDQLASLVAEVSRCHRLGRPTLVGVRSVEQSRKVSRALAAAAIEHRVLNAVKSHEEEEIVRHAGVFGAVTVATNMAGRGTDIILDPGLESRLLSRCSDMALAELQNRSSILIQANSPAEAELLYAFLQRDSRLKVSRSRNRKTELIIVDRNTRDKIGNRSAAAKIVEFGLGLHVISTEFNRRPRVAVQLRGRSGRQGSFGSTRFLLSEADRFLFPLGSRKPSWSSGVGRDEAGRVFREGAAVEKYLRSRGALEELEDGFRRGIINDYAAVADAHTADYYRRRQSLLNGRDAVPEFVTRIESISTRLVNRHFPGLDASNYHARLSSLVEEAVEQYGIDCHGLAGEALDRLAGALPNRIREQLDRLEKSVGEARFAALARQILLECSDEAWRAHQVNLRNSVFTSLAVIPDHKSAVADYIIHASRLQTRFYAAADALFLERLLTFPLQLLEPNLNQAAQAEAGDGEIAQLLVYNG